MSSINSRVRAKRTRHLINRVQEHLNFKSLQDCAIKDNLLSCRKCFNNRFNEKNFVIIRKCKSEVLFQDSQSSTHKKLSPKLHRQIGHSMSTHTPLLPTISDFAEIWHVCRSG